MRKITLLFTLFAFTFLGYGQYLTEGFEEATIPPTGWTHNQTSATETWEIITTSINIHSGANAATVSYHATDAQNEALVTPSIDLTSATTPRVRFWFNMSYYWSVDPFNNYDFKVSVIDNTTATTTEIWTEAAQGVFTNWTWYEVTLDLTAYAGKNDVQIEFNYSGTDGASLYLDDIIVEETPTCFTPTSITSTPSSTTETDLAWTAGGSETNWTYEYGVTGFTQGAGTTLTATMNSASISGLTEGETYDVYIQSNCGGTDGDSTWAKVTWTQPVPAPVNDTLAGAIPITPSAAGTGCTTAGFTLPFSTDGTTDSGMDGTCLTTDTGLDQFFTWTATTDGLLFNSDSPLIGNPGIVIRDTSGTEIACDGTYAADAVLSGWAIGDDLIIQIYDYGTSVSDVAFCLEEYTLPPPPANDDCAGAVSLTVNADLMCTVVTAGTLVGATDSGVMDNGAGTPNDDVWYSFTATSENHTIEIKNAAGNTTDLVNEVLSGACGTLTSVSVSDADINTVNSLTIGDVYYVRVFTWSSNSGASTTFDVCVGVPPPPPPPPSNDDCANATAVGSLPFNETMDATSATNNAGFISVCGTPTIGMNDGVWYTFTTVDAGTIDIAITGVTGWDPQLDLYTGSCGTFTCVDSADLGIASGDETLSEVSVDANTQYWIHIGQYSSSSDNSEGPFTIDISTSDGTTLKVESNGIENFTLFPTIVKDNLSFTSQESVDVLTIYNIMGQAVLSKKPAVTNASINVASLSSGMYIVKVKAGDSLGSYKIIKE